MEWGADGSVLTCQISLKTTDAALCTGSGHSASFEDAATNISITKEKEEEEEEDEENEKKGKEDFRCITCCCMCWHECPLL